MSVLKNNHVHETNSRNALLGSSLADDSGGETHHLHAERRSRRRHGGLTTTTIVSVLMFLAAYSKLLDFRYQQIYQNLYHDRNTVGSSSDAPQEEVQRKNNTTTTIEQLQQQDQQNDTVHSSPLTPIDGVSSSSSFKVDEYTFPIVQERLQYYMGDWYNRTDWSVPDCNLVKEEHNYDDVADKDLLLTSNTIKKCMDSGENVKNSIGITYCKDAFSFINTTETARRDDAHWLVRFGFQDRLTELGNQLPIICKARPSILSYHAKPPLWLLNERRHYGELEHYHRKVVLRKGEVPWSEKLTKLFWRGSTTGNRAGDAGHRLDILTQWVHQNDDDNKIDIGFNNVVQMKEGSFQHQYIERHYSRKGNGKEGRESLRDMNHYKYLLSVEGNDVATGLKWMLYSNSVVFMSRPTVATWAMEDLLVPYVHYIPVANDYSNLVEMVKWAEEHDDACQEISKRATEFIEHLWMSDQAKRDTEILKMEMVTMYVHQFDHALSKCTGTD